MFCGGPGVVCSKGVMRPGSGKMAVRQDHEASDRWLVTAAQIIPMWLGLWVSPRRKTGDKFVPCLACTEKDPEHVRALEGWTVVVPGDGAERR